MERTNTISKPREREREREALERHSNRAACGVAESKSQVATRLVATRATNLNNPLGERDFNGMISISQQASTRRIL